MTVSHPQRELTAPPGSEGSDCVCNSLRPSTLRACAGHASDSSKPLTEPRCPQVGTEIHTSVWPGLFSQYEDALNQLDHLLGRTAYGHKRCFPRASLRVAKHRGRPGRASVQGPDLTPQEAPPAFPSSTTSLQDTAPPEACADANGNGNTQGPWLRCVAN